MEQLLDQIRTWRRHLHAIPEIGFQEYKTSKYLYEELEKMGYQPLKITETGIAVYLDFHKEIAAVDGGFYFIGRDVVGHKRDARHLAMPVRQRRLVGNRDQSVEICDAVLGGVE